MRLKGMDDSWDWVEEICYRKYEPEMELPEDLYVYFTRKSPMVQVLIDRFSLEMEM